MFVCLFVSVTGNTRVRDLAPVRQKAISTMLLAPSDCTQVASWRALGRELGNKEQTIQESTMLDLIKCCKICELLISVMPSSHTQFIIESLPISHFFSSSLPLSPSHSFSLSRSFSLSLLHSFSLPLFLSPSLSLNYRPLYNKGIPLFRTSQTSLIFILDIT